MSPRKRPPIDGPRIRLAQGPRAVADASAGVERGEADAASPVDEAPDPGWRGRVVSRSLASAADKAVRRGQLLLSAASDLVLRSGGDDFTVQKVASEAGLTLRAFYQHFSGKDDLLIALIEESQLVMARLLTRHAARHADPLDRIGAALYWALDDRQHTAGDYNAALLRYVQRTALTAPDRVSAARRPVVAVFTRLIDDAMVAGAIERGDPERSAFALMALQSSFLQVAYLGNDLCSRLPSLPELVRFCVLGLGARLPIGWEARFVMSDEEAALSRRASERLAAQSLRRSDAR
ncbi:MAG: TetR/AcrR family transcriptional regulator [Myxococcota bacterium]